MLRKNWIDWPCGRDTPSRISRPSANISLMIRTLRQSTQSRRPPRRHNFTKPTELGKGGRQRSWEELILCNRRLILRSNWALACLQKRNQVIELARFE